MMGGVFCFRNQGCAALTARTNPDTAGKFLIAYETSPGVGWRMASQFGREDWIGVNPLSGRRFTVQRRAMQAKRTARAGNFADFNLPARDLVMAALANAEVIKPMPEMKFVQMLKRVDLLFGG